MKIALISHDNKKADMVAFVSIRLYFFNREDIFIVTTGTTGKHVKHAGIKNIETVNSGPLGGDAEIAAQVETFFNTQGNVLDVRGFHADSANIDSASITNLAVSGNFIVDYATIDSATITSLASTTFRLDSVALQHAKALQIKDSTGSVVLAGYLLSTSNTDGTL